MAEASKSMPRRTGDGFFEKYLIGKGIDIGVGRIDTYDGADLVLPDAFSWDKDNGDATFMLGVKNETYDYVHACHILEHIENIWMAMINWHRICKVGGHIIVQVPHRELYEKKQAPPSIWNQDHKFFILPNGSDHPQTLDFGLFCEAFAYATNSKIVYNKICDEGWISKPEHEHSCGEYSIEVVFQKMSSL